jgi:uncharacterized lipoprotein YehR (DUF1307 family)
MKKMLLRILLLLLVAVCLSGCGVKEETKPLPAKKEVPSDDLLSDVARQPTYGHKALRVLRGAHDVRNEIKQKQKEREKIREEAD